MSVAAVPKLSVEEYLALDRAAEVPSEYHDGELFPICGVSLNHASIAFQFAACLLPRLTGSGCKAAASPLRVRVTPVQYVYPDIIVYCGKPQLADAHNDTLLNPKVIVEVLSPSTADYDYGGKFLLYRQIPGFAEYLLVSQHEPLIEVFRRAGDDHWTLTSYRGMDASIPVESIGVTLPLSEIYSGIEFPIPA